MPKMSPPAGQGALAHPFDLFDLGVRIMRQNFRRLHPEAPEDESMATISIVIDALTSEAHTESRRSS